MALETQRRAWSASQAEAAQIDVGLRQYMLRVYNYMASGLALTGIVAFIVANTAAISTDLLPSDAAWCRADGPGLDRGDRPRSVW